MLTQTLENAAQQLDRSLTSLEERIVNLLNDQYTSRMNHRFTINQENGLLACETDEHAGIIELTEDYACAFKTEPVFASSVKDIAKKLADAHEKMSRGMFVSGSQPLAALLSLSPAIPANAPEQADLQNAVAEIAS